LVSVLGAYTNQTSLFPEFASEQAQTAQRIENETAKRFAAKKVAIDDTYKQRQTAIDAESNRWISVKADIYNAKAGIDTNKESLKTIADTLLDLRGTVDLAGQTGEDEKFRAQQFDAKLMGINGEADRVGRAFNLIGSINRTDFSPNQVEYRNDLGVGKTTLTGGYAGSDYRIEASDGTVWVPDLDSNSLTQFSALQGVKRTVTITGAGSSVTLDKTASYTNGISLVSYDAASGAITLNISINPDDPPFVVTGTLKRTGIGLMPAWFYDGLATSTGRSRAFKDINEAEARLSLAGAAVQQAAGKVSIDARRADNTLGDLSKQNTKALTDQLEASQKLKLEYTQQVQAMQNNLDQLSRQQQNYLDAFASQINDSPFLSVII
jgi:hypothetical protein